MAERASLLGNVSDTKNPPVEGKLDGGERRKRVCHRQRGERAGLARGEGAALPALLSHRAVGRTLPESRPARVHEVGTARPMDRVDEHPSTEQPEAAATPPSQAEADWAAMASSAFDIAARLVGARASLLYMPAPDTAELRLVASRGVDGELVLGLERIALGSPSPIARAFTTASPKLTALSPATETALPRLAALLRATGAREHVAVPLAAEEGTIGVLAMAVDGATSPKETALVEIASALALGLASARALERERRRRKQLEAVRSTALRIAGAVDLATALQIVVDAARSLTSARSAALGILFEDDRAGPLRASMFSGISDDHPRVHGFVGVPILSAGRAVGGLVACDKATAPEFDADDEETLTLLAEQLSAALPRLGDMSRLAERVSAGERAQRHLAAHYVAARALAGSSSFAVAAERILFALCDALGWSWGCLWIVDPASGVLRCGPTSCARGADLGEFVEMSRRWSFARGAGIPGRVWESGRPLWVRDVVEEPRFLRSANAAKVGLHGAFYIPVVARDRVVGVIEIMSTRIESPDLELLSLLAGFGAQLGELIERRRIEEEREILLAELAAERSWLRAVIERSPVAILFVSDLPKRMLANRRAQEILGPVSSHIDLEAFGARLRRTDGSPIEAADVPWLRALAGEIVDAEELSCRRPDESEMVLLASAAPISDATGRRIGAVLLIEDISSLRELEKLREEWTAMVAHDLRQPVTAITLAAGLLARDETTPESRARADRIRKSAGYLDRMISDLLDASRLDARRLALAPERVDFHKLLESAVEQAATSLQASFVELRAKEPLPELTVDPARIEQVLGNLLSNAVKYGFPGAPIGVEAERNGHEVWISVVNQGPGIPRKDMNRIFARFERLSPGGARGIGLGLYIAKGLVEAHGGRMWVESEPGRTTRFRFSLPIPSSERSSPSERASPPERAPADASPSA